MVDCMTDSDQVESGQFYYTDFKGLGLGEIDK